MKHLKLLNNDTNYNAWLKSDNYVTPYVLKIKINNNIFYQEHLIYDHEIEYLESTGTQWIDTLFEQKDIEKFSIKYYSAHNNEPGYGNAMGCRTSSRNEEFQVTNFDRSISIGTRNENMGNDVSQINEIIYTGGNTVNVNGVNKNIKTTPLLNDYHVMLFGIYQYPNGVIQLEATKIYYVTLEGNGKKIHLIPVRIGNIGYMYDTVSKQLFSNQGTGQFILGPDK